MGWSRRTVLAGMAGVEAMAGEASAKSTKPALSLAPVFRNAHFQAVPCRDCDVPGYLILLPLTPADRFNDLGAPALAVLGPTFAALEGALIDIIGCERVYFLRLSEGLNSVHFHVFPRTAELGCTIPYGDDAKRCRH